MSLTRYKEKRTLGKTPEPAGGKPGGKSLRFVVQQHAASHLHYDFRLEMDGVLKSWAVPKGPTMNPAIKRLAVMVEDHPYDYRSFEGTIPEGNYGAGTVIVWDEGSYYPAEVEGNGKAMQESELLAQLKKGKVKFVLEGKKLKGQFALVKSSSQGKNLWLLMKLKDEYATSTDVLKENKSVKSGKSLEELASEKDVASAPARKKANSSKASAASVSSTKVPRAKAPSLKTGSAAKKVSSNLPAKQKVRKRSGRSTTKAKKTSA